MTIKKLAYSTQQALQSQTGISLKRTHVYELLAASFDYRSYAALCANSVLLDADVNAASPKVTAMLTLRIDQLGYKSNEPSSIALTLVNELLSKQLRCISLESLYGEILSNDIQLNDSESDRDEYFDDEFDDEFDDWDVEDDGDILEDVSMPNTEKYQTSQLLLNELQALASRDNAKAHYVLAALHRCKKPVGYLYEQSLKGRKLTAIEQGWADNYVRMKPVFETYIKHLRKAAESGMRQAALELATVLDNAAFYRLADEGEGQVNSLAMAKNAPSSKLRKKWLKVAAIDGSSAALHKLAHTGDDWALTQIAQRGNTNAIRELAEKSVNSDMTKAWMWHYYALLFDIDLTKSTLQAFHDGGLYDGQLYDDDCGGQMFVDGDEGLKLKPISEAQDQLAQEEARSMFRLIDKT